MRSKLTFLAAGVFAGVVATTSLNAVASYVGSWGPCTSAVQGICLDGSWWLKLPSSAKTPVAEGMISSYMAGYRLGQFFLYSDWLTAYGDGPETPTDKRFLASLRSQFNGAPTYSGTPASYAAAISHFYDKYPAKRTLEVAGVLRCLMNHPEATCDVVGRSELLPWPTGP